MRWYRSLSVAAFVLMLAGALPGQSQDIPDEATRERVADWIERCDGDWSGACGLVGDYIRERTLGRWCRLIEAYWDTPRLVRSADITHPAADVEHRHRQKAQEFLEECVPIYTAALDRAGAAALDRADAGDAASGAAAERGEAGARGRAMQVRTRSNVRSGPSMAHDRVGVLDTGTEVRVIGTSGDWAEIAMPGGGNGFIYGPLLVDPGSPPATEPPVPSGGGERVADAGSPTAAEPAASQGARPDIPDQATRKRVGDRMNECLSMWRELAGWGLYAEKYAGEQGMRKFLADVQERGAPVVPTAQRYITMCESVGNKVEQSGRPCGKLAQDIWASTRAHRAAIVLNPDYYLDPDGPLGEVERRLVEHYLRTCVPAYAAVLDGRDPADVPVWSGQATAGQTGPLHGSIAFSQHDDGSYAWGIAWSFETSLGANAEALAQCRAHDGTACEEVGWFQEACGALAVGDENGYGTGWASTETAARADALEQCHAVNDECRIEASECSVSEHAGGAGRTPDGACERWTVVYRTSFTGERTESNEWERTADTPEAARAILEEDCRVTDEVQRATTGGRVGVKCEYIRTYCRPE